VSSLVHATYWIVLVSTYDKTQHWSCNRYKDDKGVPSNKNPWFWTRIVLTIRWKFTGQPYHLRQQDIAIKSIGVHDMNYDMCSKWNCEINMLRHLSTQKMAAHESCFQYFKAKQTKKHCELNRNLYHKDSRLLNLPLFLVLLANQGSIGSLLWNQVRRILKAGVSEKTTWNKLNRKG
jgi:hypothetical protein